MVAHSCNHGYLEGGDGRIQVQGQPRQRLAKKKKPGLLVLTCGLNHLGGSGRRIVV
jgi:hypothetical protein